MTRRPHSQRGFTLVEIVVAIAISAVVIVFASMFITAPINAFEAQSRRADMVGDAGAAWPRMQQDLRQALPNSLRARRNGSYVVVEMLAVQGVTRNMNVVGGTFTAAGTPAGLFTRTPATLNSTAYYLSVNNRGIAGYDAYALANTITPTRPRVQFTTSAAGEGTVTVTPAPAFNTASVRHRVYLVTGPVTFLFDETQGTIRRYAGYAISAAQTARDAPNEFAGATNTLIARGLTSCNFDVGPRDSNQPQTVAARLTVTRGSENVTLLHSARAEYAP
jgi:MSHA biogenesis protein MshO